MGKDDDGLLTETTPYDELLDRATPAERAVLEALTAEFGLTGSDRIAEAKKRAESLDKERRDLESKSNAKRKEADSPRNAVRDAVHRRWPELKNAFDPRVPGIVQAEGAEIVRAIEEHPQFRRFVQLRQEAGKFSDQARTLERQWAKTQRIMRTAENVALAANLMQTADEAMQQRYTALVASESRSLVKLSASSGGG